eukprot:8677935-Alexandrium_andersonii.AAC.1
MSASLVGSEMCIRDSCCAPGSGGGPTLHAERCALQLGGEAEQRSWRSGPVSYTHLTLPTICSV